MQTAANRYRIHHPNTAAVTVPTMQRAADYLFTFRNSPDFTDYRVTDTDSGLVYAVKNSDAFDAIELEAVQ